MNYANVDKVQIGGPYQSAGIAKDTPSRRAIFPGSAPDDTRLSSAGQVTADSAL